MTRPSQGGDAGPMETGREWDSAVAAASAHVEQRGAAAEAAAERQRPKSETPRLVAVGAGLIAVAALNAWVWTRPPAGLPHASERENLAWRVVDAAEAVDDFREAEGRLPSDAEMADALDEDVTYARLGDGYRIVATGSADTLRFDASQPIEEWVAYQAPGPATHEEGGA